MAEPAYNIHTWKDLVEALDPLTESEYPDVAQEATNLRLKLEEVTLRPEAYVSPIEAELLPRLRRDLAYIMQLQAEKTQS